VELFRKAFWVTILILIILNLILEAWHRGYDTGYKGAMADVLLQIETPENFFIKEFDIRIPKRLEQEQE
jgi:hypothetical protein